MVNKVIVLLLINALHLINSASIKKKKLRDGWLISSQGLYSAGNQNGYPCNQRICNNIAGNSNPYVNSYGSGLFNGQNLVQTSLYKAYLPGSSRSNCGVNPNSYYSGDSSGWNTNVANSNAFGCNASDQNGDANAISSAYSVGTHNYIYND